MPIVAVSKQLQQISYALGRIGRSCSFCQMEIDETDNYTVLRSHQQYCEFESLLLFMRNRYASSHKTNLPNSTIIRLICNKENFFQKLNSKKISEILPQAETIIQNRADC